MQVGTPRGAKDFPRKPESGDRSSRRKKNARHQLAAACHTAACKRLPSLPVTSHRYGGRQVAPEVVSSLAVSTRVGGTGLGSQNAETNGAEIIYARSAGATQVDETVWTRSEGGVAAGKLSGAGSRRRSGGPAYPNARNANALRVRRTGRFYTVLGCGGGADPSRLTAR